MKVTKYPQSCILIETKGKRILIDPGNLKYNNSYPENAWSDIDVLLVTHKHNDHCYDDAVKEIVKNPKTKFYTTKEVLANHPGLTAEIVKEGNILEFDDVKIEAVKAVHGYVMAFKGGKEVRENVGFIIDDGETRAYHTSDTISFDNDYECDVIFVPISNHGVTLGPWEAALFVQATKAKLAIPMHADSPRHPVDWEHVKKEFAVWNLKDYKILKIGESIKI
ncbi:MBL fold metallo-hydrolase [Bacteroidota bacterium]